MLALRGASLNREAVWPFRNSYVSFSPVIRCPLVSFLLFFGSISCFSTAQTPFPTKPLDRAQILVWMDYGQASTRVVQLINRTGIDFQPTPDYLLLLKNAGATPKLVEVVSHGRTGQASTSSMSDSAFAHLSACTTSAYKKQFAVADT